MTIQPTKQKKANLMSIDKIKDKTINDFTPQYSCRFHPTNGWHEVGCPHQAWGTDQLQKALDSAKQSNAHLIYLISQAEARGREEAYRNVYGWHKLPLREGMKPDSIPGLGNFKGGGCEVCGGELVMIRAQYPHGKDRQICPTCAMEILESILSNCRSNFEGAATAKKEET